MSLSKELLSQFVKVTKDEPKPTNNDVIYGRYTTFNNQPHVILEGSDILTPISTTINAEEGEIIAIQIKDHTAVATGNASSPAARTGDVEDLGLRIEAEYVKTETLEADYATIKDLSATNANIENLQAENATITKLVADNAEITNAEIDNLKAKDAEIDNLVATKADIAALNAANAAIGDLMVKDAEIDNLMATKADITFANIDFANVDKAKFGEFYANSGIIENYTSKNGTVTGKLVAVSIDADNITSGTLRAERILLQGNNGLFYKLNVDVLGKTTVEALTEDEQEKLQNGIHGKSIIAESITADKISVSDLVAFGATIGGLKIEDGSIHSFAKGPDENGENGVHNTTAGIYLDSKGQMNVGDQNNYIKFYEDEDGQFKLAISAEDITLGASKKGVTETIDEQISNLRVGSRNLVRNSTNLIFSDYYFSGPFMASYDSVAKNISIDCGASAFVDEHGNMTLRTSATATYDNNNIVLEHKEV